MKKGNKTYIEVVCGRPKYVKLRKPFIVHICKECGRPFSSTLKQDDYCGGCKRKLKEVNKDE